MTAHAAWCMLDNMRIPRSVGLLAALTCVACSPPEGDRQIAEDLLIPRVTLRCPGDPGCAQVQPDTLRVGAARRSIVPRAFEVANPTYLNRTDCDPVQVALLGINRCGYLPTVLLDCGTDGLCPADPGYPGADADGSQGDGTEDFFFDCGGDRICPGNVPEVDDPSTPGVDETADGVDNDGDGAVDDGEYPGPDADGTEGDGLFQAAWLAGFGNNRPAVGVLGPLDVRCMALSTGQTSAVLCVLDAVGLFHDDVDAARALLAARHPEANVDYLVVASTHTHEATDLLGQWGRADPAPVVSGLLAGHNDFVVDQVVAAAAEAAATAVPARLSMWQTSSLDAGLLHDGRVPHVYNHQLTVLEAVAQQDGATVATVVHWSNHPEILGDLSNLLSADFPGPLRTAMEQGLPATGVRPARPGRGGLAICWSGTVGGLMAPLHVDFTNRAGVRVPEQPTTVERMEAYADVVADLALSAMDGPALQVVTQGALTLRAANVRIPVENLLLLTGFQAGLFKRGAWDPVTGSAIPSGAFTGLDTVLVDTEVFLLGLGGLQLAGIPGEMFPEAFLGGLDGSTDPGMPVVPADFCPAQQACRSSTVLQPCPPVAPPGGWTDCACEGCRRCEAPDVAAAVAQPRLDQQLGGVVPLVLGLANDEVGYLVPDWQWRLSQRAPYACQAYGHYEETNSLGPRSSSQVQRATEALLEDRLR